jgi:hypothetical protein
MKKVRGPPMRLETTIIRQSLVSYSAADLAALRAVVQEEYARRGEDPLIAETLQQALDSYHHHVDPILYRTRASLARAAALYREQAGQCPDDVHGQYEDQLLPCDALLREEPIFVQYDAEKRRLEIVLAPHRSIANDPVNALDPFIRDGRSTIYDRGLDESLPYLLAVEVWNVVSDTFDDTWGCFSYTEV